MEDMKIRVSFEQAEAVKGAQAMAAAVAQTKNETKELTDAVKNADAGLNNLADTEKKAAKSAGELASNTKQTAAEAKAAAKAQAEQEAATAAAAEAARKAAGLLQLQADVAADAAEENLTLAKASKEAAAAAEKMGGPMTDAAHSLVYLGEQAGESGRRVGSGMKEGVAGSNALTKGINDARNTLSNFLTVGFGISAIVKILDQAAERAVALAEALRQLGREQLDLDKSIQDVVDNLGFAPNDTGRLRARNMTLAFSQTTGATPVVAAQSLAGAQGAGFAVADADKPETDTKLPGYGVAEEVGKFAARTRIDPDTASQLFKVLAQEGVKTPLDARKVLAMIEQGQNATAITNPAEFVAAFVKIAAGRPKGDLPNALGMLASAAINDPSAERAANKVEQFYRVAAGEPSKVGAIGQMALDAGVLSEKDVQAAMGTDPKQGDFERRKKAIDREEADANAKFTDREKKIADDRKKLELDRKQWEADQKTRAFRRLPAAEQKSRSDRRNFELKKDEEAIQQDQNDLNRDKADSAAKIIASRADLSEDVSKEQAKLRSAALGSAYQRLDPQTREAFLRKLLFGKSPEERQRILNAITEGGELPQTLQRTTGDAGAKAFAEARAAAMAAKPEVTQQRNEQYLRNNAIARTQRNDATATAANNAPGLEDAASIADLAEKDIKILQATGEGGVSDFADFHFGPHYGWASSEEGLKARRIALIVRAQFRNLKAKMPPEIWAKVDDGSMERYLNVTTDDILNSDQGSGLVTVSGAAQYAKAMKLANVFGAFVERASKASSEAGQSLPDYQQIPLGKNLNTYAPAGPGGSAPSTGGPPPAPLGESSGSTVPPPPTLAAPVGPPHASAGEVHYHYHGTFLGGLPADHDFPGRLEDA